MPDIDPRTRIENRRTLMKTGIRFALAALLLLPTTLIVGRPACAEDWGTIHLVIEGDEPLATGQAVLTDVSSAGFFLEGGPIGGGPYAVEQFYGQLSVTCQGLTPGKTYRISPTWAVASPSKKKQQNYFSFIAAADGSGGTGGPIPVAFQIVWYMDAFGTWFVFDPDGYTFDVSRKEGSRLTAVLSGLFLDPYPTYPHF
jgi:hypothetical protein